MKKLALLIALATGVAVAGADAGVSKRVSIAPISMVSEAPASGSAGFPVAATFALGIGAASLLRIRARD